MTRANRQDMVIFRTGIDALLQSVRSTEPWWRVMGDESALRSIEQLASAVLATRRKFFGDDSDANTQITHARVVAEGLREAARHCNEGQAALHARLIGAAEVIERLCLRSEVQP